MKNLLMTATVALFLAAGSAANGVSPRRDMPMQTAKMVEISQDGGVLPGPEMLLTLYGLFGQGRAEPTPTLFTLTQDTRIRCIQAPCPTVHSATFEIESVDRRPDGTVLYTAQERMPITDAMMDEEIPSMPRTIVVEDFSGMVGRTVVDHAWEARVLDDRGREVLRLGGNPQTIRMFDIIPVLPGIDTGIAAE